MTLIPKILRLRRVPKCNPTSPSRHAKPSHNKIHCHMRRFLFLWRRLFRCTFSFHTKSLNRLLSLASLWK